MTCVRGRWDSRGVSYHTAQISSSTPLEDSNVRIEVQATAARKPSIELLKFMASTKDSISFPSCTELAGKVVEIGSSVTKVSVGDIVCGVLCPLSPESSACANFCDLHELDVVKVPSSRSCTEAVACLGPAIRSYTALAHHGGVGIGTTTLIMSGASANGLIAIQQAVTWGSKVIATVCGNEERIYLEKHFPNLALIIDLGSKNCSLLSSVMEETGSLGVNIILDDGVNMFPDDVQESVVGLPSKHDVICCLAVNGRWVTSQANLQLDPPDSILLHMRNASVHFLFDQAWNVSKAMQGRYMHMLHSIMGSIAQGTLKPHVSRTVQFSEAESVLSNLPSREIGSTSI